MHIFHFVSIHISICFKIKTATPSRPQQEIPQTPLRNIMKTPQIVPKSAQRSILKNVSSTSKRRKVAFAKHDDSGIHQASDSDSSSSELMEIDVGLHIIFVNKR